MACPRAPESGTTLLCIAIVTHREIDRKIQNIVFRLSRIETSALASAKLKCLTGIFQGTVKILMNRLQRLFISLKLVNMAAYLIGLYDFRRSILPSGWPSIFRSSAGSFASELARNIDSGWLMIYDIYVIA